LFEIDQVSEQPIELAGAGTEPAEQVGGRLLRQPTATTLQGYRGAQNGSQRGAKLMGDSRQQAVPQRVQGGEPSGHLKLCHRSVGDVKAHALPAARLAAVIVNHDGFVSNPNRAPIAGEDPVAAAPRFQCAVGPLIFGQDAVSVSGMQAGLPEVRDGIGFGGVPGPRLMLGAYAHP
jgi:hypothetical protein